MTDMLAETNRVREDKKAAIDKASRDFQDKLLNIPAGQDENARKSALEFADNASKFMRMQDQLFKSGKMKFKDYTISRQNLLDGTDQSFGALAEYQKSFGEIMERAKTDVSSAIELQNIKKVEGFGNWAQSGFHIAANGQVVMALKDKQTVEGKDIYTMSENPDNIASVAHIKGLLQTRVDKYDVQNTATKWAGNLGKYVQANSKAGTLLRGGEITSIDDITKRTDIDDATKKVLYDFFNAETDYIKSSLVNPYSTASVLMDYVGKASNGEDYFLTQDEDKIKNNPAAIREVIDPSTQAQSFQFSDEQKAAATEFIRGQARSQYNITEQKSSTAQAQLQERRARSGGEEASAQNQAAAKVWGGHLANFITGNNDQVQASGKFFAANGIKLDKTADGYTFTDPKGGVVKFPYGTDPKVVMKGLVGALNSSQLPEDLLVTEAGKKLGKTVNITDDAAGFEISTAPVAAAAAETVVDVDDALSKAPKNVFTKKEADFANTINPLIKQLGFKVVPQKGNVYNQVTITDLQGKVLKKDVATNVYGEDDQNQALIDFTEDLKGLTPAPPPPAATKTTVDLNATKKKTKK